MRDHIMGSVPLVVPQIVLGISEIDEKLLQANFSAGPLGQPQAVPEEGDAAAERAAVEAYNRDAYASCIASAELPYQSEKETKRRRHAYLQTVAVTVKNRHFDIFEFVKAAGKKSTKATEASPYQKVIQLTDAGTGKTVASRQGAALEWVLIQCGNATNVAEYFANNGGISNCYRKALEAKQSAETQGEVSPRSRRARSNEAARSQGIPVIGLPVGVDGEFTFVIRLTNGCGEVIAAIPPVAGSQDIVQPTSPSAPGEVTTSSAASSSDEHDDGALIASLTDSADERTIGTETIPQSPAEPESEQASGAGDAADNAVQVQIDENETDKEQV